MSVDLDELKRYIDGKFSEQSFSLKREITQDLKQYIDSKLGQQSEELKAEIRTGFEAMGEAIDVMGTVIEKRFNGHDGRITRLEKLATSS